MVTSRVKMRSARSLWLSFSSQLIETTALYRDPTVLAANVEAANRLVTTLGNGTVNPRRQRNGSVSTWEGVLWEDVSVEPVQEFLATYRTHPGAHKAVTALLGEFIGSMARAGELTC
jgi:hypothetical protein